MRVVLLSGGVGGARLARGLAGVEGVELTVVTNVADDDRIYGLDVSPDLDTVLYTLAGVEGPHGWGRAKDRFTVMEALEQLPIDTTFTIGDLDLATNLFRTDRLRSGWTLSWVMTALSSAFSIGPTLLPATDDRVRTMVRLTDGSWIGFQEYFVHRGHLDEINDVRFEGADVAKPAPGVMEAIEIADLLVIGPSNPPLSIWPILAIKPIAEAAAARGRVVAVSPLIGGTALKGPAHRVLRGLGFPAGNAGVVAAYGGLLTDLYVDVADGRDAGRLDGLRVHVADTHLADPAAAVAFATKLIESG